MNYEVEHFILKEMDKKYQEASSSLKEHYLQEMYQINHIVALLNDKRHYTDPLQIMATYPGIFHNMIQHSNQKKVAKKFGVSQATISIVFNILKMQNWTPIVNTLPKPELPDQLKLYNWEDFKRWVLEDA